MRKFDTVYLGDSVYAACDGEFVHLTTRNGLPTDPSNSIYLEAPVVHALFIVLGLEVKEKEIE